MCTSRKWHAAGINYFIYIHDVHGRAEYHADVSPKIADLLALQKNFGSFCVQIIHLKYYSR